MPFGEDFFPDGDLSPPLIQSDLLNSLEAEMDADFGESAGPTVVALNGEAAAVPEADMDIRPGDEVEASDAVTAPPSTLKKRGRPSLSASATPAQSVTSRAPSSALRKRGRPSLSASATPAKSVTSRTPRSTKSTAAPKSAGRSTGKRKAVAEPEPEEDGPEEDGFEEKEPEATPVRKRGRPARSAGAAASARLAAKAASKPTRGRPKATTATAKPARKAGRPKKDATDEEVPADEYEVESIADSIIDADTMEHMYLVKWKNYPASDNTWEPKTNLKGSLDLVRKFDAAKKKAEAAEAAKKAATKKAAAPAPKERNTRRGAKPKAVKEVKAAKKGPGRPRKKRAGA